MLGPVMSQICPDACAGPGDRSQCGGDERLAGALVRLLDHRMPSALDGKAERGVHLGPHVVLVNGEFR